MPNLSTSAFYRRDFLKAAGATMAMWAGGQFVFAEGLPSAMQERLRKSLAANLSPLPKFDGVFVFDDSVCRAMAADFGHYVHKMPIGVLFPKSASDFKKAVSFALNNSLKIAMRGTGGAAYGQSQADQGIVIDSSSYKELRWVSSDEIDAHPGALWSEVVDFAKTKTMAPPVYPDTLFISVGGTLNTGGTGSTSYRLGAQVDHVVEMDVVTGEGKLKTCSPVHNAELFHMTLAGMGQCAFIVRARLKMLPSPSQVITREFIYSDMTKFVADLALVAKSEPQGAIAGDLNRRSDGSGWDYVIAVTNWAAADGSFPAPPWMNAMSGTLTNQGAVTTYYDYLNRATAGYQAAVKSGAILVPHVYMAFFLPDTQSESMLRHLVETPNAALGANQIAVYPMIKANFTQTLQRMPESDLSFHIRIYRKAKQEGDADHLQMLQLNQNDVLPTVLAAGGTLYLPFSPLLDTNQRLAHFGQDVWTRFAQAKAKYDPANCLTPGAGLF